MGLSSHISSSSSSSSYTRECCLCFQWVLFFLLVLFGGFEGVGVVVSVWKEGLVLSVAELQHLLLY